MSTHYTEKSLNDVHASIDPARAGSKWKKLLSFFGPAYLVSVGYMDPGNWATDIAGGSGYGYKLIWVLLMSNFIALLLQSLSARLGIVRGQDLAQCSRDTYPRYVNITLYILAEIAIAACDMAEVLGMAIGLNLLFHIPLLLGVVITLLDTFLLLYLQKLGMRKMELFIISLIAVIGGCFFIEIFLSKPNLSAVSLGFIPSIPNSDALYIAIGIIGATVMPHNLYLHSALVQTRKISNDPASLKRAIKFNTWDSAIALNIAFFVNAAILVLAGSVFFTSGHHNVGSLQDAHQLLAPLLGTKWASTLFAIGLIAAGQSSTITGTLAGQIVMEGYLHLRINPVVRRLVTRLLAIIPTFIVLLVAGDKMIDQLLVFSQVLLSMQLAFAVIPLIHFVSDKKKMGVFAINNATKFLSWGVAVIILVLNIKLVIDSVADWFRQVANVFVKGGILLVLLFIAITLIITIVYPLILRKKEKKGDIHPYNVADIRLEAPISTFSMVALALDFSDKDNKVVQYALQLATHSTSFVMIHVVESVSASIMGTEADDRETRKDQSFLDEYVALMRSKGFDALAVLGFRDRAGEIARIIKENNCDLLIIGSHGHKTSKDWLFGETINSVRHLVEIPVFIAR